MSDLNVRHDFEGIRDVPPRFYVHGTNPAQGVWEVGDTVSTGSGACVTALPEQGQVVCTCGRAKITLARQPQPLP